MALDGAHLVAEGMAERTRPLEDELLGATSAEGALGHVATYCEQVLGSRPVRVLFYAASVGAVYGLALEDGRDVVVKLHRRRVPADYLVAVQDVQRHVARSGLPAPEPLAPPTPYASSFVTAEAFLGAGRAPDPYDRSHRDLIASGLARFVAACRDLPDPARLRSWFEPEAGSTWPAPHDIRFDFPGTTAGAEWIDAIGARALSRLRAREARPSVVGHHDWRREHLRVDGDRLTAIYDWDSVSVDDEPILVAGAMRTFPADWSLPDHRQYPTREEMEAFLLAYERERGAPFGGSERETLNAALVYGAAYTARCEHSDRCTDFGTRPPTALPRAAPAGTMSAFLEAHASELLGDPW
jgi:Ser/Thr protein kinase RdoA (MazF antagonist)